MNWVDVLILIVVIRISYVSFQDGLSKAIFPLVSTAIIIVAALYYYQKVASLFLHGLPQALGEYLSFVVIAGALWFILKLASILLDKLLKVQWAPAVERIGGLVVGVLRSFLVASLILTVLMLTPLSYFQWSIRDKSFSGVYFLKVGATLYDNISWLLPSIRIREGKVVKSGILPELMKDKTIANVPAGSLKNSRYAEIEKLNVPEKK